MIELLWPWLALVLPLPWLVYRWMPGSRSSQPALRAPFFEDWRELAEGGEIAKPAANYLLLLALALIWLLLVVAAMRPMWVGEPIELPDSGRDLMLAVDISGSMRIEDMQIGQSMATRVEAVKAVASQFIDRRRGDRLGLILFGSNAYVQSPLSFDTATVTRFLREAQIGFAGQETAIGDAIGLAVKRLRERPAESRVLILLTDGQDTASTVKPLEATMLAAEDGIRIHTIGIGAEEMTVPGLLGTNFGSRRVNPSAELDEETLRAIASRTGGNYFRARNPKELAEIYLLLDDIEPVEHDVTLYRPRQALSYLPLLGALAISLLLAVTQLLRSRPLDLGGEQP